MSSCEKCWGDAYVMSLTTWKDQADCYRELIQERNDNPCTPEEQAGEYWDEELQCDRRSFERVRRLNERNICSTTS